MKKNLILAVSFLVFSSFTLFAQTKVIEHKVGKGDTVTSIARKYNVSASDIYRLNPEAIQGIKLDAVIKIPNQKTQAASTIKKHVVVEKETVYSIARKYAIKPAELKSANKDVLKGVLKPGVVLDIPLKTLVVTDTVTKNKTPKIIPTTSATDTERPKTGTNPIKRIYHTVGARETKFSIAKQHNLTLGELEELNPDIKYQDFIEVGMVLRLVNDVPQYGSVKIPETITEHVIQPQETLFGLAKRAGLTEEEFLKLNPALSEGVKAGLTVKMPADIAVVAKPVTNLSENLTKFGSKNLVLLLPFNTDKYGTTNSVTIQDQLKKDKFVNMTLDFYAGALIAIDSAKKMGLPIKVQVLDSKETPNTSSIASLNAKGSFKQADAIVGPFFQNQVESLANLLTNQNVVIVSPLSNEKGKPSTNLYQSMPSSEDVKTALINYMHAKNGNIIAIVDPKKGSARKQITESFPSVKMASFKEDGFIDDVLFKQLLDKERANFVILETESTSLAVNATKTLANNLANFNIQLVTLDKNDVLESDEILLSDLTKLKLLYPSVTNDASGVKLTDFVRAFRKQNNTLPNKFATRGFDVTFDTILRLFNQEGFLTTAEKFASEQTENKFNYVNVDGAYYNKGVYLMYYDTDLTIKEAK